MRINLFDQMKAFYSWVFANQDKPIKPHHHSLYFFLLNQNNRTNWIEWFKCPFDLGMMGSGINSKHTYYKVLKELADWGLIQYQPGINNFKAPLIKIEVQKCTSTSTATGPQPAPLLGTNKDNRHLDKRQETKTEFTPEILEDEHFDEPKDEKLNERISKATKIITEFFSISELRQPKHYMTIGNFVRYHANKGDLDFLADQFTAYKEIKSKDPKYKHNWYNYIGSPEKSYQDGTWNLKNWVEEIKDEKPQVDGGYLEKMRRTQELLNEN